MQLTLVLSAVVAAVSAISTTERNILQKRKIIIDGEDNKFGDSIGGPIMDVKGNPADPKSLDDPKSLVDPKSHIDPAFAGTSKIMGGHQAEELKADLEEAGVLKPGSISFEIAEAEAPLSKADAAIAEADAAIAEADKAVAAIPTDIKELINTHMTPEQKAELALKEVQKIWYGRVLKKFNENLQAKKPIDLNELIYTDLNEDERKIIGLTDAQNAWFAGVLTKLAASRGAQVTYRPELKHTDDSEKKGGNEVTSEKKGGNQKSKGTNDEENGKDMTTGKTDKALPAKDASSTAKNATSHATSHAKTTNSTRTKTNITASNDSKSTGMGSHAVQESWAVFAGAVAAAMILFV